MNFYHTKFPIQIMRKTIFHFNLTKRIIVFVSNPENVKIYLNELKHFLSSCMYPEHAISRIFFSAKLQGLALN